MTDSIYNVDATALFYTAPEPDYTVLLDALNAAFEGTPGCYVTKSALSHDGWWLLSCEQFHIMLGFEEVPAPMARFAQAVTSPINRLSRFEYDHAVQNHNLHVTIEIGDGNAPLPPEARRIMREFGSAATCDPVIKLKALHVAAQFIAAHTGFLALHFAPSDRLFSADDLRACASQQVPVDLLLHPVPTEVDLDAHGRETWALRLRNPEHLPGPAIEIEGIPKAVPLATAVNLLRTLHRAHGAGKLALKAGDAISPTGKWALHVFRLDADATFPNGRIVLSFYKDRIAAAPLATDPDLETAETAPHDSAEGFAAKALASLRSSSSRTQPASAQQTKAAPTPPAAAKPEKDPHLKPVSLTASPEKSRAAPHEVEKTCQDASGESTGKVSLLGWMVQQCKTLPRESRARSASLALVIALSTLANPYAGFTGGVDTRPAPREAIATATAMDVVPVKTAVFAALRTD